MSEKNNNRGFRNIVDLYDIFGYLIPGLLLVLVIFFIFGPLYLTRVLDLEEFNCFIANIGLSNHMGLIYFFLIIVFSYIFGHLIATVSSMVIDRMLVRKTIGYPYRFLLKINEDRKDKISILKINENKLIFLFLEIFIFFLTLKEVKILFVNIIYFLSIFFLFVFLTIKLVRIIIRLIPNKKEEISKDVSIPKYKRCVNRICYGYAKVVNGFFGRYILGFTRHIVNNWVYLFSDLDESVRERYIKLFNNIFSLDSKKAGTENYWLSAIYLNEKSPNQFVTVRKFLSLYGFARNLSMSLFIAFILSHFFLDESFLLLKILLWVTANLFLMRYLYLYFNYYTKYIFRAFIVLDTIGKGKRTG